MSRIFFKKGDRKPSYFATLGFITVCLAVLALLVAGPVFKFGLIDQNILGAHDTDLRIRLLHVSARLILVAGAFSVACIIHGRTSPRARVGLRGFFTTLMVIGLGAFILPFEWQRLHSPALHDISTNLDTPPQFLVLPNRQYDPASPASRAGSRADKNYRTLHTAYYADLAPISVPADRGMVILASAKAARSLGWKIMSSDTKLGHLEAEYESLWFGFKSRIALDVRAKDAATLLDIRVVSVLGTADMGIGADLIRDFRHKLADVLAKSDS